MKTTVPIRTLQAFRMLDWRDGARLCEVPLVLRTLRHGEIVGRAVTVPNETSR
ncbi:hypothetical protein [Pseudomonas azerbaijanorientalis]|jgi:hypothetical protein|uniref:hypothetical protein n=1 Tax=Pseudomonas azerbaijanorientalis TaxID=2842350 RepID=UPI001878DA20|nr:hypothetical protein [Pseudomonas azerbaijanorientalis]QXH64088.1 hypothetical protein KSS91_11645 [Pseudomonas azerbaijanorientalis]